MRSKFLDLEAIFIMLNAATKLKNYPKTLMTKAAAIKYDWYVNNLDIFQDTYFQNASMYACSEVKVERSCKLNKLIKIYALK